MKHKYIFLLASLVLGAGAAFAQSEEIEPVHLTFDVDNASRVVISVNGEELNAIQTGITEVDINPWSNLSFTAAEGSRLVSVTNSADESLTITNNSASVFISDTMSGETYKVVTAGEETVSFSIVVDDAAAVSVCDRNYQRIDLTDGTNQFSFAETRFPLIVGSANYGSDLYKVELDGVEVAYNYGYAVTPQEGSVINIISAFPDTDCEVKFIVPSTAENFFTAVTVNEKSATDFMKGLTVKCGDSVQLYYNQYCWLTADEGTPVKLTINGTEPSWFGPGYSFVVRDDTDVELVSAEAAPKIPVVIDIDNTRNVIVYRCSESFRDVIELTDGENTVEIPQEYADLVITTVENEDDEIECKIVGVTVNGTPKKVDYYNYLQISDLDANDVVKIFTEGYESGVERILTENFEISGNVYNLQGIKVMENATRERVSQLPAGIYIVNGHKVCIK